MFKCERKVIRKFALEAEKSMHKLCPTEKANKYIKCKNTKFSTPHASQFTKAPMTLHYVSNFA